MSVEQPALLDPKTFALRIRAIANALVFGQESSRFRGAGIEFDQSRPYQPGDPVRHIDWRVSARTGKPFLKEYEAPRHIPVILLIDDSRSMRISSVPSTSKFEEACLIAGGIALAATERVNPVGFACLGSLGFHRPPSPSRDNLLNTLEEIRSLPPSPNTAFAPRISTLLPSLSAKSLLVVLSDLHDPNAVSALRNAAQRHDTIVIQLSDPSESNLPKHAILRSGEAETGRSFTLGLRSAHCPPPPLTPLVQAAIDSIHIPIHRPYLPALVRFLSDRSRRRTSRA
jgi:uncharacterized protein (DUF58 family)